jgi:YVTN family beta-propeller protein
VNLKNKNNITMFNQFKKHSFLAACFIIFLTSCGEEEKESNGKYDKGFFVVNEGPFGTGSGSVTHIDGDTKVVENNLFQSVNQTVLGNIVQSMTIIGDKAYIVVNNANKVEVVNRSDFKSAGTLKSLALPRYVIDAGGNKAYVSQWGRDGNTGSIKVVNLQNNTIVDSIATGKGPEAMLKVGSEIIVACRGGFSNDNIIQIINPSTNKVVQSITVGANPNALALDANGKLWVLCGGKYKADFSGIEVPASLIKVDVASRKVETTISLLSTIGTASNLVINKSKNILYYNLDGQVYSQSTSSAVFDKKIVIKKSFYGLGINPADDLIYGADPLDYASKGRVYRYKPTGVVLDSFTVDIIPSGFVF